MRPVWAEVDVGAVRHNARRLRVQVPAARLCAVVKANGYGHGAVAVARGAIEGGAGWLAVASVEEGVELREAGIEVPVLLLSEPPHDAMDDVVDFSLVPTIYTHVGVEAAAKASSTADRGPLWVHVKVDTGMHRVGASPSEAVELCEAIDRRPELLLEGFYTHLAVADTPDDPFTEVQLTRFEAVRSHLGRRGLHPALVHAANSAAAIAHPASHYDLVRCGIALYGIAPSPALEGVVALEPAMALKARVAFVKDVPAGDGISYGLRYRLDAPSVVATVPLGYADGVPRRLAETGGEVLVGGRRRRIAGTITMDQLMVDCGDGPVSAGDEVVLLGAQGTERIGPQEWASRLGTIAYEVVCGIGPRVPRVHVGGEA